MTCSRANHQHRKGLSGRFRRALARARRNDSGAAVVEFGVIVPVLAFMAVAVGDIGLGMARKMQVDNAVQLGVAYAMTHGFDANAISAVVAGATNSSSISASPGPVLFCGCATASGITAATCGSVCPSGAAAGTYVTVSAQTTYNATMNYPVVPGTYTFNAQGTVRLQ